MPPPIAEKSGEGLMWDATSLFGDEFIVMVISSAPSLVNKDQPSSGNPLTASLKPLQSQCIEFRDIVDKCRWLEDHRANSNVTDLLSL